jgi:hypothetical protein
MRQTHDAIGDIQHIHQVPNKPIVDEKSWYSSCSVLYPQQTLYAKLCTASIFAGFDRELESDISPALRHGFPELRYSNQ